MNCSTPLGSRFGRFNLVGLLGSVLQLLLFYLSVKHLGLSAVKATPIAVELTLIHNFLWHEWFTWRYPRPIGFCERIVRLLMFHVGNGFTSLAGNTLLTHFLMEKLRVPALMSALAAIVICAPLNFVLADRWIFKRQMKTSAAPSRTLGGPSNDD